jgi:hypothetical protein
VKKLDQQEDGKNHEYLATGSREKGQNIIERVFFLQEHLLPLWGKIIMSGILKQTP